MEKHNAMPLEGEVRIKQRRQMVAGFDSVINCVSGPKPKVLLQFRPHDLVSIVGTGKHRLETHRKGISHTTSNTTSSGGSSAVSGNSAFSAASGADEPRPTGQILPLPNLRIFSFAELKVATRNFRQDTVLGEGGFGKVYKGWLDERANSRNGSGTVVAIKRLDSESMQGLEEWQITAGGLLCESEVNFLGRLSHPNLVRLMGYCWEETELLLVYEFMQKGSLENHLFGRGSAAQPLPWDLRIKVLIGSARGLAFLHMSEKQSYNAKISDFGLAKMGPSASHSHVTTRVMGTYGYAAPEYVATALLLKTELNHINDISESSHCAHETGHLYVKSDVYGFGVVLVEMLTGLRALDPNRPSGQHNLVDWIKPVLADRRKLKNIMDSRLEGKYPSKAAVHIAQLALTCLGPEPKTRPPMKEVVETLERVGAVNERPRRPRVERLDWALGTRPESSLYKSVDAIIPLPTFFDSIPGPIKKIPKRRRATETGLEHGQYTARTNKGITRMSSSKVSLDNNTAPKKPFSLVGRGNEVSSNGQTLRVFSFSELKAATKSFRTVLGEGGFGRVYKGLLVEKENRNGNEIAIKRLSSGSVQGFKEWQAEVIFLGMLSHPNLVRLLGYCNNDRELLLVYEFMQNGSLENHLFRRGSAVQPLPWDIRLKVLIGAARGLAFLSVHRVIFRDFKTSNILLDGSYCAKLSDFGLAKSGPTADLTHVSTRVMGTYGYAAPEYIATGHLSTKSDVYSFGVVLVELLTGLRALDKSRLSGKHMLIDWAKPYLAKRSKLKSIMDARLEGKYALEAAAQIAQIALACLRLDPKSRPSMEEVVEILERTR
ncbi:hypothetical protein RJ639_046583 [Escallonia herrerae]|uniref:non-specific serine/threonine protein kinase n=1 Tax=Escallonia herrerae TaxID=1293975 RepID=A0AA89B0U9_9ASTE|nr:hypothetical protein RJ639_046583 [Escallonia herrerae]